MKKEEADEGILASEVESVGSCDSLIRDNDADVNTEFEIGNMYSETHIGQCLNTVLNELMDDGDININQQMALRRAFNYVHYDAYTQCSNKLHMSVSGKIDEFSILLSASSFTIKV